MAAAPVAAAPILKAEGITKSFPGVKALDGVSFDLVAGEIHALCGENGAGKSTLIKLLAGIHPHGHYEGALSVDGRPAAFGGVADAEAAGIAVICQELALVPAMTVAENIFLGAEPTAAGLIDWGRVYHESARLMERFGVKLDCYARAGSLGMGLRQLIEIVKALRKESRILILDEPTAALSGAEVAALLDILRDLRRRGIACVYISHKLDEVFALADRITVLRDGRTVATLAASRTDKAEVIRHMVGREIADFFPRRRSRPGETLLAVRGLDVVDAEGAPLLKGVSFEARAGEVLGIGGLMGSGRTELLMHLFGSLGRRAAGSVELAGRPWNGGPGEALRRGLALVTEDRKRYGLVLDQSVGFNLSLSAIGRMTAAGLVDAPAETRANREVFESLRVKAPGLEARVGSLSGGNQQKVVIGKALQTEPRVVFLDEPTRGIDVGAKLEVYEIVNRLTDAGKAVVLVSSELPELMGMSDRVIMLHEGAVGGEFRRGEATQEALMAAALGHRPAAA
ncbi:MAG: sugar ABC transporter ATP-binding protein [Elusimicrobia bacterium]|nr:sugar ABC transporter ATP-binding protein [Elusimicrobiota bacterium]